MAVLLPSNTALLLVPDPLGESIIKEDGPTVVVKALGLAALGGFVGYTPEKTVLKKALLSLLADATAQLAVVQTPVGTCGKSTGSTVPAKAPPIVPKAKPKIAAILRMTKFLRRMVPGF